MNKTFVSRKLYIVMLLSGTILILGLLSFAYYLYQTIINPNLLKVSLWTLKFLLIIIINLLTLLVTVIFAKKKPVHTYIFLSIIYIALAFILSFIFGTTQAISYLIYILIITSSSVVVGINFSLVISLIIILFNVLTLMAMGSSYTDSDVTSLYVNTIVLNLFIILISIVVYLSNREAVFSNSSIKKVSENLHRSNVQLEERIRKLANNQDGINKMIKPILHDISTPISIIEGSFEMIGNDDSDVSNRATKLSLDAIERVRKIVQMGAYMISGDISNENFYVRKSIEEIIYLMSDKFQDNKIALKINIDKDENINGNKILFERIIQNVLLNSLESIVEENNYSRVVCINGYVDNDFILMIKDNGSGIDCKNLINIFNLGYSTKYSECNQGIGLTFVKDAIEKYFNGSIIVESEKGKYTSVILRFRSLEEES